MCASHTCIAYPEMRLNAEVMGIPLTRICPWRLWRSMRPARASRKVVLEEPEGPAMASTSLGLALADTLLSRILSPVTPFPVFVTTYTNCRPYKTRKTASYWSVSLFLIAVVLPSFLPVFLPSFPPATDWCRGNGGVPCRWDREWRARTRHSDPALVHVQVEMWWNCKSGKLGPYSVW